VDNKEIELPPHLVLDTGDYDRSVITAQDAVSRMTPQEKLNAMRVLAQAFSGKKQRGE
jgi:hypothetical protein